MIHVDNFALTISRRRSILRHTAKDKEKLLLIWQCVHAIFIHIERKKICLNVRLIKLCVSHNYWKWKTKFFSFSFTRSFPKLDPHIIIMAPCTRYNYLPWLHMLAFYFSMSFLHIHRENLFKHKNESLMNMKLLHDSTY